MGLVPHELLFLVLAFAAELLGAASGVSSSTLFVPLARILESVQVTLALTAFLHVFGNAVRLVLFFREINWRLAIKFGAPALVLTGIGAQFSDRFSGATSSILLGLFLIIISILFLFSDTNKFFNGRWLPYVGGSVSGFLTGFLGSGGSLRALALAKFGLNPFAFLATSTLIDFGGDLLRLVVYIKKDFLNNEHLFYIPFLLVIAVVANILARTWLERIQTKLFNQIVLVLVFVMGCASVVIGFLSS